MISDEVFIGGWILESRCPLLASPLEACCCLPSFSSSTSCCLRVEAFFSQGSISGSNHSIIWTENDFSLIVLKIGEH